jgi:hypothetical protein
VSAITASQAAALALALPEAVQAGHHGRPSFRVNAKIFATLPDATHMNVMLDESGIRTAVQAHPHACAERWWGRRLAAVTVELDQAGARLLSALLADAWEGKAPARLSSPPTGRTPGSR